LVLSRVRVVQQGTPAELAAVPGIYRDTLARQIRRTPSPRSDVTRSSVNASRLRECRALPVRKLNNYLAAHVLFPAPRA
jgi:hypothetical protein